MINFEKLAAISDEELARMLQENVEAFNELSKICTQRNIELCVVYITKVETTGPNKLGVLSLKTELRRRIQPS